MQSGSISVLKTLGANSGLTIFDEEGHFEQNLSSSFKNFIIILHQELF